MARTALITGGASGIGLALTRALVAAGDHVVIADLDGDAAAKVVAGLTGPGSAEAVALDVRDGDAVAALIHRVDAERVLDLLVNNAGIGVGGRFEELTAKHWALQLDVNLMGVVHGCLAAYPLMRARRAGQILNTASMAGLLPAPGLSPYATSKHAVVGLTKSLRAEAAPHGVRVSALCPGWVNTPLLDMDNPPELASGITGGVRALVPAMKTGKPVPASLVAADTLSGLARNKGIIVTPRAARVAWWASRLSPALVDRGTAKVAASLEHRLPSRG